MPLVVGADMPAAVKVVADVVIICANPNRRDVVKFGIPLVELVVVHEGFDPVPLVVKT